MMYTRKLRAYPSTLRKRARDQESWRIPTVLGRAVRLIVLCVLVIGVPKPSFATLILQAEPVTVTSPGTGFFDVFAVINDATPRGIGSYNVRLDLSPTTFNVSLDSAETALIQPLFAGQNPSVFAAGNFLRVADNLPGISEEKSLVDGSRLFRVAFSIPGGVPLGTVFSVNFNPAETLLFDGLAAPILIDGFSTNGSITTAVPEPAAWVFMGIASMVITWGWLRRRPAESLSEV